MHESFEQFEQISANTLTAWRPTGPSKEIAEYDDFDTDTDGLLARLVRIGRTILLVWGAVSLTGMAGGTAYYGYTVLGPQAVAEADAVSKPVAMEEQASAVEPPRPAPSMPATTPAVTAVPVAPTPAAQSTDSIVLPAFPAAAIAAAEARLPRAKPDEPVYTGSVTRRDEPEHPPPRRFRQLSELPFGYAFPFPFVSTYPDRPPPRHIPTLYEP